MKARRTGVASIGMYVHPTRKRRVHPLPLVACVFLVLFVLGSASLISSQSLYTRYQYDTTQANDGVHHLQNAEALLKSVSQHLFQAQDMLNAQREFALAANDFARVNGDVQAVPTVSNLLPVYGKRLEAASLLLPAALDLSRAGETACSLLNLLSTRLQNPLTSKGQGITLADFAVIQGDARQVLDSLSQALDLLAKVQPNAVQFNTRLSTLVAATQAQIPAIRQWLGSIEQLLPALPTLLGIGTPTNYLIEILDSSELRPGGGFIGNYGIASVSGGRLADAHITDVDLLDRPFEAKGGIIPYPSAYAWFPLARQSWSFRDSNLDANFPTSAQYGEQNYKREGGKLPVQGVIAITPMLIQQALTITGPIYIPEYQETITSQNIIARIHYYQLGPGALGPDTIASPDGHSSLRKRFTELLAEHFLARVHQLSSSVMPKFLQVLFDGLRTKDIQLYFNENAAETLLHMAHLDSTIAAPNSDSLMVVDANVSPNKANSFIHYILNDSVTLDGQGNATHHATLTYAWTIYGIDYGVSRYRDYVRLYLPPDSVQSQESGLASVSTGSAFGRKVWSGFLYLSYGQAQTIILSWRVPHAATKDAQGWHYQELLQRQPGILWQFQQSITLPGDTTLSNVQGGPTRVNSHQVHLVTALSQDMNVMVHYAGE